VLKHTKKLIPPFCIAVPLLGLVIAIGAIGQRAQPVLSKQMTRLQATSNSIALKEQAPRYTWMEKNFEVSSKSISKEARLRRVLNSSSSQSQSVSPNRVSPGETYIWMQRNTSSDSNELAQDKTSASTNKTRTIKNKASIKGGILRKNFPKDDGVFLYGSLPQAGQFGTGYIVFEKRGGKVVGGMYMLASEFNCFQGTLDKSGQIAMSVKGYAGDINLNQVASTGRLSKVSNSQLTNYAYSVTLEDYYQLDNVGNNERRILKACKAISY